MKILNETSKLDKPIKEMKYAIYWTYKEDGQSDSDIVSNKSIRDKHINDMVKRNEFSEISYAPIYSNGEYGPRKFIIKDVKEVKCLGYRHLVESSLSRIKKHSENGFFTISACRGSYSDKENFEHTEQLKSDIRSYGLGFIPLIGGYIEHDDNGNDVPVEELSLFVPYQDICTPEQFSDIVYELALKYDQEGYLLCSPIDKKILAYNRYLDSQTFVSTDLGKFSFNSMSSYYSRLKKGGSQRNIKYVFEGVTVPSNVISRQARSLGGEIF